MERLSGLRGRCSAEAGQCRHPNASFATITARLRASVRPTSARSALPSSCFGHIVRRIEPPGDREQRLASRWGVAWCPDVMDRSRAGRPPAAGGTWSGHREGGGVVPGAPGDRDLTDGAWLWPEGLSHSVEVHAVHLPDDFVDDMRSRGWRAAEPIARWADREESDRPPVDRSYWISWAFRHTWLDPAEASQGSRSPEKALSTRRGRPGTTWFLPSLLQVGGP
jgi:hypothetical protein